MQRKTRSGVYCTDTIISLEGGIKMTHSIKCEGGESLHIRTQTVQKQATKEQTQDIVAET